MKDEMQELFEAVPWYLKIAWFLGLVLNFSFIAFIIYLAFKLIQFFWSM